MLASLTHTSNNSSNTKRRIKSPVSISVFSPQSSKEQHHIKSPSVHEPCLLEHARSARVKYCWFLTQIITTLVRQHVNSSVALNYQSFVISILVLDLSSDYTFIASAGIQYLHKASFPKLTSLEMRNSPKSKVQVRLAKKVLSISPEHLCLFWCLYGWVCLAELSQ